MLLSSHKNRSNCAKMYLRKRTTMRSLDWRKVQPRIKSSKLTESWHLNSTQIATEHLLRPRLSKNLGRPTLVSVMNPVVQTMTALAQRSNTGRNSKINLFTGMISTQMTFSGCFSKIQEISMTYWAGYLCKWDSSNREGAIDDRIISTLNRCLEGIPALKRSECPEEDSLFLHHLAQEVLANQDKEELSSISK